MKPHLPYRRQNGGFTLLEMLVVLVIIASLTSLALLSGYDGRALALRGDAERLAALIAVYAEDAMLDNREYGVYLEAGQFSLLAYDEQQQHWIPSATATQHLAENVEFALRLDGHPFNLTQAPLSENRQPQILLLSSGEISPFVLTLTDHQDNAISISSDGFNLPQVQELNR